MPRVFIHDGLEPIDKSPLNGGAAERTALHLLYANCTQYAHLQHLQSACFLSIQAFDVPALSATVQKGCSTSAGNDQAAPPWSAKKCAPYANVSPNGARIMGFSISS